MSQTVTILCEGPHCNAGRSAKDREAALVPRGIAENVRGEHEAYARGVVSHALALRPHVRCGVGRYGTVLYGCVSCGFERVYGNSMFETGPYA